MNTLTQIRQIILLLAFIGFQIGCTHLDEPAPFSPPDAASFDAGRADDGGIEVYAACPVEPSDLFNNAHSPYVGGEQSVDLEVVTFSNFGCSHCADFADSVEEIWKRRPDINNRVRFYFHHFPFDYQLSWDQHRAARAAANQGMESFWDMHDYIYGGLNMGEHYDRADLSNFAEVTLGLDMIQFAQDTESDETLSFLLWDRAQGQDAGITATPSVFVCEQKINWEQLETVIDILLED
jgi:protein-disulfide isomerase